MQQIDARPLGRLLELGAVIAATADHGMNAKCDETEGKPRVIIHLEQECRRSSLVRAFV